MNYDPFTGGPPDGQTTAPKHSGDPARRPRFYVPNDEIGTVLGNVWRPVFLRLFLVCGLCLLACGVLFIIAAAANAPDGLLAILLLLIPAADLTVWIVLLVRCSAAKRQARRSLETQEYSVEKQAYAFVFTTWENGVPVSSEQIAFSQITKQKDTKNYRLIWVKKRVYPIPFERIAAPSETQPAANAKEPTAEKPREPAAGAPQTYAYVPSQPAPARPAEQYSSFTSGQNGDSPLQEPSAGGKPSKLPNLLTVLLVVAFMVASVVGYFLAMFGAVWFFIPQLLAMMVAVVCVVVGAKRKKADRHYRGTMIGGIIALILLALSLSVNLLIARSVAFVETKTTRSTAQLEQTEQLLGVDFPAAEKPYRVSLTVYDPTDSPTGDSSLSLVLRETSVTYFKTDDLARLRELTAGDDRWLETVPNSLYGLFPDGYRAPYRESNRIFDLLYNADTGEYNRVPAAEGTYRYIHVRVELGKRAAYLTVTEYDLTYIG